jgi:hypothetical protein
MSASLTALCFRKSPAQIAEAQKLAREWTQEFLLSKQPFPSELSLYDKLTSVTLGRRRRWK